MISKAQSKEFTARFCVLAVLELFARAALFLRLFDEALGVEAFSVVCFVFLTIFAYRQNDEGMVASKLQCYCVSM